jgi:transposase
MLWRRVPLGHVTVTEHMHMSRDDDGQVRRIEVFTGSGRRRVWSDEDKSRIVAESFVEGETVSGVARRHGLTAQQLFGWRRAARNAPGVAPASAQPLFAPAIIEPDRVNPARVPRGRGPVRATGAIELEIDGVNIRVGRGADAKTVTAVLRALKTVG